MTPDDLPRILKLERRLFPIDAWSESMFRDELRAEGRHYIVAEAEESGGEVVGYAGLRTVPPQGDVQTIAVDEPQWGSGIGAALLTELLAEAARREVAEVFLDVRADNPRAQRLYRRFGFTEIGSRRSYYRDGVDAIVMSRRATEEERGDV